MKEENIKPINFKYAIIDSCEMGGSTWQPTDQDIIIVESHLQDYLKKYYPNIMAKLLSYKRQYTGVSDGSGDQTLYINFFVDDHECDWTKDPLLVEDGGDDYFHAEVHPKTGKIISLIVNGDA